MVEKRMLGEYSEIDCGEVDRVNLYQLKAYDLDCRMNEANVQLGKQRTQI